MKKNTFILGAVVVGGLVFFPDDTRRLAWGAVNTAGDLTANAAAGAIVSVEDRVEDRREDHLVDGLDSRETPLVSDRQTDAPNSKCKSCNKIAPADIDRRSEDLDVREYSYNDRYSDFCGTRY